jgi:hypothetical protein
MPDDLRKAHHHTKKVTLHPGERVVGARVDVDDKYRQQPCKIAFLLYDFI